MRARALVRSFVVLAAVGSFSIAALAMSSWAPGPWSPQPSSRAKLTDAECERCHVDIAKEQRDSLHRHAFTDPYFVRALGAEDTAFCRGCHAPESSPDATDIASKDQGVGCIVCHVDGEAIVGVQKHEPTSVRDHMVEARPLLGGSSACAGCHEFAFPGQTDLMQRTHSELASSSLSASACETCHMSRIEPNGVSHFDHGFKVQSNDDLLRSAVVVVSSHREDDSLTVELAAGIVGHSVPTGDLHRSIEVRATIVDREGHGLTSPVRTSLMRSFVTRGSRRVETSDTRIPPPSPFGTSSIVVSLKLPRSPHANESVHWEIVWQRMSREVAHDLGMDIEKNEKLLHEGVIQTPDKRQLR